MLLAQNGPGKLEDLIVSKLHEKGVTGPKLLTIVQEFDPGTTKETFYRIVRKLIAEEVITKQDTLYQLNLRWLQRVYQFSKKYIYKNHGVGKDNINAFQEGDKISYKFRTPNLLSIYWAHMYDLIYDELDSNAPILISHPHEWFIHTRAKSESFFLNRFDEDKKLVFLSIRGSTSLDKAFKKEWESEFRQIGVGIDLGLKKTEYINVLGDFIIQVSMSKKFSEDLEAFFEKYPKVTNESKEELERLCNRKDPARMVFIRSRKEAEKWRQRYRKYFFIPRNTGRR